MYPNLLVSKVLKAKHFVNDGLMNAKTPKSASRIWQSLMPTKDLVEEGLRKKIGDGRSVRI